jgi:hypothetical protein
VTPGAGFAALLAAALGASVWALSPLVAGTAEPWDAPAAYYACALAIGGAISGGALPRALWAHYPGAVLGQALYAWLVLGAGPLFVLGVLFLFAYGIIFFVAAVLAAFVRVRCADRRRGS